MEKLYLSRRNLLTLLAKLDRVALGEPSQCSLIKQDMEHPDYPSTCRWMVTAVEDADYYTDRLPGHSKDAPPA